MFYTFLKRKIVLVGLTLLIASVVVFMLVSSGAASGGFEFVSQALRAAFGGVGGQKFATDIDLYPSSTFVGSIGQGAEYVSEPAEWPAVSRDLQIALNQALIDAGVATASSSLVEPTTSTSSVPRWCDFSTTGEGSREIILNEIAWMGSLQASDDEWIELKNASGHDIDVRGWQVLNRSGSIKINIATGTIASESFLVLKRGEDYSGALPNTGDWLKVFDRDCEVVDELNASNGWLAGNNTSKKTLERDVDGIGWHTSVSVGGSPGAQNSVISISESPTSTPTVTPVVSSSTNSSAATSTPTSTQSATAVTSAITHIVIASIQVTGGEGMTDQDYVRIFNPAVGSVDVSGWKLRKRTKTGTESSVKVFPSGSTIPAGGYFTWANSTDGFASAMGANTSSTQILSSDNSIALLDASDNVMDSVAWGSGHVTPYIEGSAYPENPGANQQLTRKSMGGGIKDTENNAEDFTL